jgi:hypothetical protein
MMKSFLRTGMVTDFFISSRSWADPWKNVLSVRMETAAAPFLMEALRDLGAVEDPENALGEAMEAMGHSGMKSLRGANVRLTGKAITLIRGILQDYCDALEALPARTVISAHRYAEKRMYNIRHGKKRPEDRIM